MLKPETPNNDAVVASPKPEVISNSSELASPKLLSAAAQRALAEAEERRQQRQAEQDARQKEVGGRNGLEPTRYGDWEVKGIASDF